MGHQVLESDVESSGGGGLKHLINISIKLTFHFHLIHFCAIMSSFFFILRLHAADGIPFQINERYDPKTKDKRTTRSFLFSRDACFIFIYLKATGEHYADDGSSS